MVIEPNRDKVLFNAALDIPNPAERLAFLDRECSDDRELRRRLGELLGAHDEPTSVQERSLAVEPGEVKRDVNDARLAVTSEGPSVIHGPIGSDRPGVPSDLTAPGPERTESFVLEPPPSASILGTLIAGRYKIREEIGEGGMGCVYLAEQTQPVKRKVALKLIKAGMDSRTVLARFESERQALALMDHPNIAKVLDAGTTESGRPFFVMELVKGIPLTDYCDQHRLDLPSRLALFRQICSAVQHAHQKGIIHRDLKPTNILVESHDDKPVPKVIDFGLAKATSGLVLTDQSLYTAFGNVTGTPLYMAPEQATFNALDVDTRTDIYALGVILYELLTGSTPIQRERMKRAALDEMLRVIREDEPPTPSSRIGTSEGLPSLAANRHIEPGRLSRFLKGDLDWIVMKALAKDRNRRYDSAIGLANDVERFTNHEPVTAGPPTARYRIGKYVRRNRVQVVAAALVLMALVGGIVGTSLGLIEADRQQQRAEKRLTQVSKMNDILGSIFADLDPRNAAKDGKPLSAVLGERLDKATAEIEGDATGDPLAVARMQMTLGMSQRGLGYSVKALGLFSKAYTTYSAELGPNHPDTLWSMANLAASYLAIQQWERARPLLEEVLKQRKAKLGLNDPDTLISMLDLANCYHAAGQRERALTLREEVFTLSKANLGPDHPVTLRSMANLAFGYHAAGQEEKSLKLREETLALRKAKFGPDHPETLVSMTNLATTYYETGQRERGLKLLEETLARSKATLGPDHPDTLWSMKNLGHYYHIFDQPDRAVPLLETALSMAKVRLGPKDLETLAIMGALASAYRDAGQPDLAMPLFEEGLVVTKATLGLENYETLFQMTNLAENYQAAGKLDRAIALHREAAPLWKKEGRVGVDAWRHPFTLASLGWCLLERKEWTEAESVLREALAIYESKWPNHWYTSDARALLGWSLLGQGRMAEAEPMLRSGFEGMKKQTGDLYPRWKHRVASDLDRLIQLAEATHRTDDVKRWQDEKARWLALIAPKSVAGR